MTVCAAGKNGDGKLLTVTEEREAGGEGLAVTLESRSGKLHSDLRIGADVAAAKPLLANRSLTSRGFMLFGAGFIVTTEEAAKLEADAPIKDCRNGRDLTDRPRGVKVIDLFGLSGEDTRSHYPATYQWVYERVKPERDQNRDKAIQEKWWLFGRTRSEFRPALMGLPRYIATVETAKHRAFQFLDAHRKRQQAQHTTLTLTGMYNVRQKIRAFEPLTAKDKAIHEQGLLSEAPHNEASLATRITGKGAWKKRLPDLLQTFVALGRARKEGKTWTVL